MEDVNLKSLLTIESDLVSQLQAQPVFQKLEAIRIAIKTFQINSNGKQITSLQSAANGTPNYDATLPWTGKIKIVLQILGEASTAEIIREVQKYEPSHEKKFLDKRIGVTLSQLKNKGAINSRMVNKKRKYFIK